MEGRLHASWCLNGLFLLAFILLLFSGPKAVFGTTRFQEKDQVVVLLGKTYEMAFDKKNGAMLHIKDRSTGKEVCQGNKEGIFWRIGRLDLDQWRWRVVSNGREDVVHGAGQIARSPHIAQHAYPYPVTDDVSTAYSESNPRKRFFHQWEGGLLTLNYEGDDLTVRVICRPQDNHVDFRVEMQSADRTILTFNFPYALLFDADHVKRVGWPIKLGICLKKPFYEKERLLEGTYPTLFSDFTFLESSDGAMRLYGIQDQDIFWPTVLGTGSVQLSSGRRGFFDHGFFIHVAKGETWRSPGFRVEIGPTEIRDAADRYGKENGLTTKLARKMPNTLYHRFCQSPTFDFDQPMGNFRDDTSLLRLLPAPMILKLQHWMLGGFDREYPNFLPPNPRKGSPAEFRRFCDEAEKLGFLVETYINYTWVSTEPPSPLFQEKGTDVFALNLDGSAYAEQYSSKGYTLSLSHPGVRSLHRATAKELVENFGVDMIYHDQIGCRPFKYDARPRDHGPYAYIQDIIDMAEEASEYAPIACEGGFDRLITSVSRFDWPPMGGPESLLDLSMRPGQGPGNGPMFWTKDLWEPYPWLLFLFHDKVSFSKGAIDLSELSWALLIGAQLHTPANVMNEREREWLTWISLIQKHLGSQYMGKSLSRFRFAADNIYESRFNDVHVICNLSPNPYRVSNDLVISRNGFYFHAEKAEVIGGAFSEYNGVDYGGQEDKILFQQRDQDKIRIFVFFNRPTPISIKRPASWGDEKEIQVYQVDGMHQQPIQATVTKDLITFTARHDRMHPGRATGSKPMTSPALSGRPLINPSGSLVMVFLVKGPSSGPMSGTPRAFDWE